MPKTKPTWTEKFAKAKAKTDLPAIILKPAMPGKGWAGGTILIPSPGEVEELMVKIPKGKLALISDMAAALAKKHGATLGCPMTTGIFAWMVAHAAAEGASKAPYWRTVKGGGELNAKYPGGISGLKKKLVAEGHRVVKRGKKFVVADFAKAVVSLRA